MFFYFQLCLSDAVISLTIFIFECPFVSQDNVTKRKQERENIDFSMVSFFSDFFQRKRKGGGEGKIPKAKSKKKSKCSFGL